MPFAARINAQTPHPGVVTGPGVSTVMIAGLSAAVVGDLHTCSIPSPPGPHPPTPFTNGSTTVQIGGRAALRVGDMSGCGAAILNGAATVEIGG